MAAGWDWVWEGVILYPVKRLRVIFEIEMYVGTFWHKSSKTKLKKQYAEQ